MVGRQVVSELVKAVTEGVVQDPDVKKRILQDTLNLVQPKIVSYEEHVEWLSRGYHPPIRSIYSIVSVSVEQVNSIRLQLAELFESEEEWSDAARILMGLSLDSSQRSVYRCPPEYGPPDLCTPDIDPYQIKRSSRYTFVLSGSSLRTRTTCKPRHTTTALPSWSIQRMTKQLYWRTNCVRPGSWTTLGSSWKPPVGTTSSAG